MIRGYFTGIRRNIINELRDAKKSIKVAVYWFTNQELFDVLITKVTDGVKVSLIIHNDYINNRETGLDFQQLIELGGSFYFSDNYNPMHNKFCIIDDKVLINGSYNWTYYAETRNSENILIIKRKKQIIKLYTEEYDRIISLSEQIQKIIPLKRYELEDNRAIRNKEYLANELLYQASYQEKKEIVDQAFQVIPGDIAIQQVACNLNLVKRLKLKHSIGSSLKGDNYLIIVPKDSIIPYSNTEIVQTSEDNQTSSWSKIYYGENPIASKNHAIHEMRISGLPPKPAGESKIKFIATIDLFGNFRLEKISIDTGARSYFDMNIKGLLSDI